MGKELSVTRSHNSHTDLSLFICIYLQVDIINESETIKFTIQQLIAENLPMIELQNIAGLKVKGITILHYVSL